MWLVLIPVIILFSIILIPAIPKIGGEVRSGLLISGLVAALLGGLGFTDIIDAAIYGIDMLSWVIMLSIFGSIYSETQVKLGTMDTTLNTFRSLFGSSSKGLVAAVILTLILAGSLLGDAIAAATVIGFLIVGSLRDLKLSGEQVGAIIVMGAVIGSGLPPISQAFFLSSSLVEVDPGSVLPMAYITVGLSTIVAIITGFVIVRNKPLSPDLIPDKSPWQILKPNIYTFIPLFILAVIVVAASVFEYNIFEEWVILSAITDYLKTIPIVQGITFRVVTALIAAIAISFLFPKVRQKAGGVITGGLSKVNKTVQIQLCAGFMVGVFYRAGLIEAVQNYTESLASGALKLGGGISTILVGMLSGSQTTAQTVMLTFLGPVLTNLGDDPINVATGGALFAMAGQSMPPVGLTTFVVAGIVAGMINAKVDPVKIMIIVLPVSLFFAIAGFFFWFI